MYYRERYGGGCADAVAAADPCSTSCAQDAAYPAQAACANPCSVPCSACTPAAAVLADTITIRNTTVAEAGSPAAVIDVTGSPNHILDFVLPLPEYCPALLFSGREGPQTAGAGSVLLLDEQLHAAGDAISHAQDASEFVLCEPGLYEVFFHACVSLSEGSAPVTAGAALRAGGAPVPGAFAAATLAPEGTASLQFCALVQASAAPLPLLLVSPLDTALFSHAALYLKKVR